MRMAFGILDLAARLLMALGVGCLLLGGWLAWQTLSFAQDAERTTGEVVAYQQAKDGTDTTYRPRVRFKTRHGDIITVTGQLAAKSKRFPEGTQVPVVYKTSKPTEARIALFTDNWLGATLAAVIGLAGLAGGFLVRRGVRREVAKFRP